jgi:NDP-sugar pyrophosphorylase family protein
MKKDVQSIKENLIIPCSFEKDVFPMLSKNLLLDCFKVNGNMIDVGTRESYIQAHTQGDSNWIEENVVIGNNTIIRNSVVFESSKIGSNVEINESIILKDKIVPNGTVVDKEIY